MKDILQIILAAIILFLILLGAYSLMRSASNLASDLFYAEDAYFVNRKEFKALKNMLIQEMYTLNLKQTKEIQELNKKQIKDMEELKKDLCCITVNNRDPRCVYIGCVGK